MENRNPLMNRTLAIAVLRAYHTTLFNMELNTGKYEDDDEDQYTANLVSLREYCEAETRKMAQASNYLPLLQGEDIEDFISMEPPAPAPEPTPCADWEPAPSVNKVQNKTRILEVLKAGGFISYESVFSRVRLLDSELNQIGTVIFDTYIKMLRDKIIARCDSGWGYERYALIGGESC